MTKTSRLTAAQKRADALRASPAAQESYRTTRAAAQAASNEDGRDRGLEYNALFGTYSSFLLPAKPYRVGHELRCEVVSCDHIDRTLPGHGQR